MLTLAEIRQKFWIQQGKRTVMTIINNCYGCKQFTAKSYKLPLIAVLPKDRTKHSKPFQHIGLDYMGPINVKHNIRTKKMSRIIHMLHYKSNPS